MHQEVTHSVQASATSVTAADFANELGVISIPSSKGGAGSRNEAVHDEACAASFKRLVKACAPWKKYIICTAVLRRSQAADWHW